MANEQVRIDLTANDQASKKIDAVADDVEQLEKLDPEVQLTADDKASATIGDVRDDAEQLAKLDPEVHITADDDASRKIEDVRGEAEQLSRADTELVLKARIDDARAGLKLLRDDLEQTGDRAADTQRRLDKVGDRGPDLRGNAIADLTGPLGEASGAASDFAGVFDGLSDISEKVAGKVGVSAEAMAGAIGGIGVAVAAAAALWTLYRSRQEAARKRQEELVKGQRDLNKAIADGDRAAAANKFVEMYEDALVAAGKFGVNAEQATRFIRGQTDALPALDAELRKVNEQIEANGGTVDASVASLVVYRDQLNGTRADLEGAADGYRKANGELADQDRRVRDVGRAFGSAERDATDFATAQERVEAAAKNTNDELDRMRGALDMEQAILDWRDTFAAAMNDNEQTMDEQAADVLALKQAIVDAGEATGKSPWQIRTELEAVDAGDMQQVKSDVEAWYKAYPITLASKLDRPGQLVFSATGGGAGPRATAAVPEIGTLNMMLPAGWRGDPIRLAHAQRRRSGRYFARAG